MKFPGQEPSQLNVALQPPSPTTEGQQEHHKRPTGKSPLHFLGGLSLPAIGAAVFFCFGDRQGPATETPTPTPFSIPTPQPAQRLHDPYRITPQAITAIRTLANRPPQPSMDVDYSNPVSGDAWLRAALRAEELLVMSIQSKCKTLGSLRQGRATLEQLHKNHPYAAQIFQEHTAANTDFSNLAARVAAAKNQMDGSADPSLTAEQPRYMRPDSAPSFPPGWPIFFTARLTALLSLFDELSKSFN